VKVKGVPEGHIFIAPRPASFCSTYNTRVRFFSAEPHPKAGRGYGGVILSEVLYDVLRGHRTGGSRGLGRGHHPFYSKSHS
jgi:hypothetical protein